MPPTREDVLADPGFYQKPLDFQEKVLSAVDPAFSGLNPDQRMQALTALNAQQTGTRVEFAPTMSKDEIAAANALLAGKKQPMAPPPPPSFIDQALAGLAQPFKTTARELRKGFAEVGHAPEPGETLLGGAARRGMGVLQTLNAPVTGFIYEPLMENKLGEVLIPPFLREKTPQPVKDVLNKTAALGGTIAAAPVLTQFPRTVLRSATQGMTSRLNRKEALRSNIDELAAQRAEEAARVQGELQDIQGAATGVGQQADDALTAQRLAQAEAEQVKATVATQQAAQRQAAQRLQAAQGLPPPPPIPSVDPVTAQAAERLRRFPLRTDPTNIPAIDESLSAAGEKFVGTGGPTGLFKQAARNIKKGFTDRINQILPENVRVVDTSPIQQAASAILPKTQTSNLGTPAQKIAGEIDDILSNPKLTYVDKAELMAERINQATSGYAPGATQTKLTLDDVVRGKGFTFEQGVGGELAKLAEPLTASGAIQPLLRDIHGERTILRAMKRAAEKSGHSFLRHQLQVLENGYTQAINQSIGKEGADALLQWDKDYAYAAKNLFGFESLPYKLSGQKAEDFATLLFKRSGKAQEETALRTMELLGPEQRSQMGQSFLEVVSKRSQTPELPFDPVKWGKEYFSYKNSIKNSVLSLEHKRDLDDIARVFVRTPARQQAAAAARQAQVEARQAAIREAGGAVRQARQGVQDAQTEAQRAAAVFNATKARAGSIEDQLVALRSEGKTTESLLEELGKPGSSEKVLLSELKELNKPGSFERFLRMTGLHSQWRLMWGMGALAVGRSYGVPLASEAFGLLATTAGLNALLKNERGARLVRLLAHENPGSPNAIRLGIAAQKLLESGQLDTNSAP